MYIYLPSPEGAARVIPVRFSDSEKFLFTTLEVEFSN